MSSAKTAILVMISVLGWLAFLVLFRSYWPGPAEFKTDLDLYWVWLVLGTIGFTASVWAAFALFSIPADKRLAAAVALTAPALCCDMFATIWFEQWFVNAGSVDDRVYAALILGSTGVMLLSVLFGSPRGCIPK